MPLGSEEARRAYVKGTKDALESVRVGCARPQLRPSPNGSKSLRRGPAVSRRHRRSWRRWTISALRLLLLLQ